MPDEKTKRPARIELEKELTKDFRGGLKSIRDKAEAMLFYMDNKQGHFPIDGYEFEAILLLLDMVEKYENQHEFLNSKSNQKHKMCRDLTEQRDIAKDTLIGVFELSKVYENELYGNSYKGKCLDQASRLKAMNKGARAALKALGYSVEEKIEPQKVDLNQLDLYSTETRDEE